MTTEARAQGASDSKAAIFGAALGGVAVGVAAMIARKIAVQRASMLAGDWDEALAVEHKLA